MGWLLDGLLLAEGDIGVNVLLRDAPGGIREGEEFERVRECAALDQRFYGVG
jgi:hypothetical protein